MDLGFLTREAIGYNAFTLPEWPRGSAKVTDTTQSRTNKSHPVRDHQGIVPHVDRNLTGANLRTEIHLEQQRFTEARRQVCCEPVQWRRSSSCDDLVPTEEKLNPIQNSGSRHTEIQSEHEIAFLRQDVFGEHVATVRGAVQEHSGVFREVNQEIVTNFLQTVVAHFDTHAECRHTCHHLLSDITVSAPRTSGIKDLDDAKKVVRMQPCVVQCLAHEAQHIVTRCHLRYSQGQDAGRKPHHAELFRFH
mmetsp:Transcript_33246/g.88980  ORF Transcript_33246/g.88980 Transcript_33246/m.88980 type:complete len:248 (+) Transcript_33246:730-1473(+)